MNPDPTSPPTDPTEARITAFLLGELPPAEAEQLRSEMSTDPALARLHDRLKFTLDLVREAVTERPATDSSAEPAAPRLAEHRRQALLAQFKSPAAVPTVAPRSPRAPWLIPMAIAASLVALLGIAPWFPWSSSPPAAPAPVLLALQNQVDDFRSRPANAPLLDAKAEKSNRDGYGLTTPPAGTEGGTVTFWKSQPSSAEVATPAAISSAAPATVALLPATDKTEEGLAAAQPSPAPQPQLMARYGLMAPGKPAGESSNGRKSLTEGIAPAEPQRAVNTPAPVDQLAALTAAAPTPPPQAPVPPASSTRIHSSTETFEFQTDRRQQQLPELGTVAVTPGFAGFGGGGGGVGGLGGDAGRSPIAAEADSTLSKRTQRPSVKKEQETLLDRAGIEAKSDSVMAGATPAAKPAGATADPRLPVVQALSENRVETAAEARFKSKASLERREDPVLLTLKDEESLAQASPSLPGGTPASGDEIQLRRHRLSGALAQQKLDVARKNATSAAGATVNRTLNEVAARDAKQNETHLGEQDTAAKRQVPAPIPQPEVATAENSISTFSLNVTDVSFKLAAASLDQGVLPDPATIRSEEFINAFDYRDPEPAPGLPVGLTWERAQYPFAHRREILRLAVRTAATGRQAGRPLHLVLLLDNSGSMERGDRVQIVRESLRVLARRLQPHDLISVVTFARNARLWIEALPGDRAAEVADRVGRLTPEGGTNLEEGLNLAYATVAKHFRPGATHRIALLTDGAANLGEIDHPSLERLVESWRRRGVALDCYGIGWEGYNDDLLARLSSRGDGRYGFLNTVEQAPAEFARQLAGALQIAAADLKVQVEFNPQRVRSWRQIGYARHQLAAEQFRDNSVDAAELAAAETGNALYVIETIDGGTGPLGVVRVRYREPGSQRHHEQEWPLAHTGAAPSLDTAPASLKLAVTAAAFSEWLAGSPFAGEITPDRLLPLAQGVPAAYAPDPRPQQLEAMLRQAKSISGK